MKTRSGTLMIEEIPVEVVRARVRNVNIRIYPPDGRVRVAAPARLSDEAIRIAVGARVAWIRTHRERIAALPRPAVHRYESGERHLFEGRAYPLRVVEAAVRSRVTLEDGELVMWVRPGAHPARREALLSAWYRTQLRARIAPLVTEWEARMGVSASEVRVKRMRTLWGSCNTRARRVWLNLELIKRDPRSLEYVVVHELCHLIERSHGPRFQAAMDRFLPDWRARRAELNATPVGTVPFAAGGASEVAGHDVPALDAGSA